MEVENAYCRPTFRRDHPPGCGNFMPSSSLKTMYGFTRDFPNGCGPNVANLELRGNLGGLKRKPPLGPSRVQGPGGSDVRNFTTYLNRPMGPPSGKLSGGTNVRSLTKSLGGPLGPTSGRVSDVRNFKSKSSGPLGSVGSSVSGGTDVRSLTKSLGGPFGPTSGRVSDVRNFKPKSSGPLGSIGGRVSDVHSLTQSIEGKSKVREKVLELLKIFRGRCDELLKEGVKRVDIEASKQLTRERKIVNQPSLMFGHIPGVEIGDKFYYRAELRIVGLHRLPQGGIDSMEYNGERCATCIVANEGHMDKLGDPNVLTYIGEGGVLKGNMVGVPPDQQLTAGNLALYNSMKKKRAVRVVRGMKYGRNNAKTMYVYDGLYEVTDAVRKKGHQGNIIFEFLMKRNPGQPAVRWTQNFS